MKNVFSTAPLPPSHTLRSPSNQLSKAPRNDTAHDLHAPRMHAYTPLTTITRKSNSPPKNIHNTNCQRTFQRRNTSSNNTSIPPRRKDLDTPCRFQPQEDRQTKGKEERFLGTRGKGVFSVNNKLFFRFRLHSVLLLFLRALYSASLLHTLSIHSHTRLYRRNPSRRKGERGNGMARRGS
jgi:hypothetical protein